MSAELKVVDVWECPVCHGFFREDGGDDNLVVHVLAEHPRSALGLKIGGLIR